MHLIVCGRTAGRGIHQRSHHAGEQAHSGCGGSAGDSEFIKRDTAGGSKFEAALVVQYDDGVSVGAGDDPIANIYAHPGGRADGGAADPLNLHLATYGLE